MLCVTFFFPSLFAKLDNLLAHRLVIERDDEAADI